MASKTENLNMALSHLGIGKDVANIETERSPEATAGRRFYDVARDFVAVQLPWPFLTKITTLALVEEDPNDEWAYSYQYPSDCIHIRRILSGVRNDSRQTRSPYRITQGASGKVIFSDVEDAEFEYTVIPDDPSLYSADYTIAFSYYLAFLISPRVTKGDQFKLGQRALELFEVFLSKAGARLFNEEQAEQLPEAEYITARD